MKYLQQLKKIQSLDLTQEKIAQYLNVSFPTINSWLRKKSIPNKKHQAKIDFLYQDFFGWQKISADELAKKRAQVLQLQDKNILQNILKDEVVLKDLVIKITYHTNTIEGSTLTERDTAEIIFEQKTIVNHSLREHLEATNHRLAFLHSLELANKKRIQKRDILKIHQILMSGILENAGMWRNHAVRILRSHVPTANYLKIDFLMDEFVKKYNRKDENILQHLAQTHAQFEQIHPFSDGNGRVGRLLMIILALKNNLPPVLIVKNKKNAYYQYLQKAQLKNDFSFLENFIAESILTTQNLLEKK